MIEWSGRIGVLRRLGLLLEVEESPAKGKRLSANLLRINSAKDGEGGEHAPYWAEYPMGGSKVSKSNEANI